MPFCDQTFFQNFKLKTHYFPPCRRRFDASKIKSHFPNYFFPQNFFSSQNLKNFHESLKTKFGDLFSLFQTLTQLPLHLKILKIKHWQKNFHESKII